MDRNFARALPLVLKHEGGYVDHPRDPGGATNKGVTIATFRRYVKKDGTKADLRAITDKQVATVYYRHYWSAVNAQALPAGVDYAVFDFAVNSGPHRAAQFLQRVVGISDDGRIGPKTIEAVEKMPAAIIIKRLCGNRLDWLKRLKTWSTFGRGWTRRVQDVEHHALAMVGKPADVVEVEREKPVVPPKARHVIDDAATNGMDSTTILSSGGSVISTVLSALVENKPAQIILVCAAVVLVAYVVIERLRKGKRANEARDELDRMGV